MRQRHKVRTLVLQSPLSMFLIVFRIEPLHHRVRTGPCKRDLLDKNVTKGKENTKEYAHHWLRVQGEPFDFLQGFFGNVRRFE